MDEILYYWKVTRVLYDEDVTAFEALPEDLNLKSSFWYVSDSTSNFYRWSFFGLMVMSRPNLVKLPTYKGLLYHVAKE